MENPSQPLPSLPHMELPSVFQSILPLRIFLLVSSTLILGFLQPQARAHIQLLPDLGDLLVNVSQSLVL